MWVSDQVLLDPRFRFHYFVPHVEHDVRDSSPLQLYSPGLLRTAFVFRAAATWPADIRELSADVLSIFRLRALGLLDRRLMPVEYSAFEELQQHSLPPFLCVLSTDQTAEFVDSVIRNSKYHWLHISTHNIRHAVPIEEVTPKLLHAHALEALSRYKSPAWESPFDGHARGYLVQPVDQTSTTLDAISYGHGITIANETALRSFRFELSREGSLGPDCPDAYVRTSVEAVRTTEAARYSLTRGKPPHTRDRLIVAVFTPAWYAKRQLAIDENRRLDTNERRAANKLFRALLSQDAHHLNIEWDVPRRRRSKKWINRQSTNVYARI